MINLILAQYNKDGKFQGFLELYNLCNNQRETTFLLGKDSIRIVENEMFRDYWNHERDEKDPLNRFNGLFNGRTYGQGDFVLIKDDEDDIVKYEEKLSVKAIFEAAYSGWCLSPEIIGNLHQNPELYK